MLVLGYVIDPSLETVLIVRVLFAVALMLETETGENRTVVTLSNPFLSETAEMKAFRLEGM